MKKRKISQKRGILFCIIGLFMLNCLFAPEISGGAFPAKVSAKVSKSTKKKAAKAYRNLMYESDYTWFRMQDIDKDGIKELVVSYRSRPIELLIYKYQKGCVRRVGEDVTAFGFYYNKKTKRIHGVWGGAGNIEDWYLTISKSGKLKKIYLSKEEKLREGKRPVYHYYYAGEKISRKIYLKKCTSWRKNYINLKMYKTSMKNIKKYIK